jgi:sugar phosphate isomerase/epimerase
VADRSFGVSTRLYQRTRLGRDQLLEVAAHGFDAIDLVAIRSHLDYHNPSVVADLQQWLAEAQLTLNAVHAPVDEYAAGRAGPSLQLASSDPEVRALSVDEAARALQVARRLPFRALIVHLGTPRALGTSAEDNSRDAARRSIAELREIAAPLGVRIALEVFPGVLAGDGTLVHFIEKVIEAPDVGICLDVGHAGLEGDPADAIETVSEHLLAVELHDNRGRTDDHAVPFEGTIDWAGALTNLQKVGYEQTLTFEVAAHGSTKDTLVRAERARRKMTRLLG